MINLNAQDDIHSRVIFLGNAGEINPAQTAVIENAASQILSEKTRVVYLGNNIYPDGFPVDERESSEKKAVKILESQFLPMRQKGAEVIFIPGYREWDNNGPNGLGKIMAFNGYIEDLEDENIKVLPPNGQPGVESIELSENLAIAILDSEWWLYPFEKGSRSAQRGDKPEGALEAELREFLFRNRNKTIILALHHPFISYGKHAGEITWKDHLFPLTNAEKNLYIPLPVVGSLYPLTKTLFPDSQDLRHPLYKDMVKRITKLFDGFPNLIIVSSHDDGLQLLEDKERGITQIITGIGGNIPYTKSGKKSLFNASLPGYVVMDLLQDGEVKFTFYGLENNQISNLYEYKKPHEKYEDWKDDVFEPIKGDSIKISPSVPYDKLSKVGRFLMGENFRKTWGTEVTLPVLRLSEIDGGLKPIKLGGGNQSTTARLVNPDGKTYALRSVEKRAEGITPEEFQGTFVTQVLDDGTSSLHPYGALVVPPIAEAAGVPHSHPIIGVIAPDSVLGSYQKLFVGKINLLEEREPLPPTDNYRKALKKLRKNNKNTFDAINFLNARMLDLLIADWDRHDENFLEKQAETRI